MKPKKVLVIQTAFIGDVILATSILENIHLEFPETQIDFLVRKGNEGLFKEHPFVNNILIWHKKEGKYSSLWQLLKQIRNNAYDWVINLQRYGATGILTGFSKSLVKSGFDKNPFSFLFTHRVAHAFEAGKHEIQRNHNLLWPYIQLPVANPRLYPSTSDLAGVAVYKQKPYICMAPASVWFTKQYPEHKWVELIDALDGKYTIYILGAPSDSGMAERIRAQCKYPKSTYNLPGKLSLLESAALMKDSLMNYVNDSAPMHLCSAVNAPVTAIFCSTVPEFGYGPLSSTAHVVQVLEELPCRPCGIHGHKKCPKGHFHCGEHIQVSQLKELVGA
jgi:ADP-heptose:LPS heptosyltransferase